MDNTKFELITPNESNIIFKNNLRETAELNFQNFLYFYDGGGISTADVNGDNLPDLFLTANMGSNRLYLNEGNFVFSDITDKAGVAGNGDWSVGTTIADVNGDGLPDIYVCNMDHLNQKGRNELFINNGDSTFTEMASDFGLDFSGLSKQASFFDYDNDGDLDMYLLTMSVHRAESYTSADRRNEANKDQGDRLFRNDNGKFTDVTEEAGIYSSILGYGLGVAASDLNMDGCIDIYISNDFHENDYLYLNNCDGTFREVIEESTGHTSRASMGNDIADYNNDLKPDIMVVDMLPVDEEVRKATKFAEPVSLYITQRELGYHHQLIRNTLQLNLGTNKKGVPVFSEIAQFAGVDETDWSWAPLFMDFNNDGLKDLFISNGIYRRPNDLDYLVKVSNDEYMRAYEDRFGKVTGQSISGLMPKGELANYALVNNGDLTFSDRTAQMGLDQTGFSGAAAYADFDRDGDLDLVINNINDHPYLYRNNTTGNENSNFLKIDLEGERSNTSGIGAKIIIYTQNRSILLEQMPVRGFQSSVDYRLHTGLGSNSTVDSLTVVWPDQRYQTLYNFEANRELTLSQADAAGNYNYTLLNNSVSAPVFKEISSGLGIEYKHEENDFNEFIRMRMIPHMLSREGPALAVGDVNNDGLDDLYTGGGKWQTGGLFIQQKDGSFENSNQDPFINDRKYEDTDACFFDANGDGFSDLYVVSGNNEEPGSSELADRLYLNNGKGNFIRSKNSLPDLFENGSVVAPYDFDGDGDIDLFIGNRSIPGNYGMSPDSYLLENDGSGQFSVLNFEVAPQLRELGMVTDAIWGDLSGDGFSALVVAGEWMPVRVFQWSGTKFKEISSDLGLENTEGWWFDLHADDFDGDGDLDIVAGNRGLNGMHDAIEDRPYRMFINDFDGNGRREPLIVYQKDGVMYPAVPRDEFFSEFKSYQEKFPLYSDYSGKSIYDLVERGKINNAIQKTVKMFESVILLNENNNRFDIRELPAQVQFSPVRSMVSGDFNLDGNTDLIMGGNFYPVKPSFGGRYDAGYGWFLGGRGDGTFNLLNFDRSGIFIKGEAVDMETIKVGDSVYLLTAQNDDSLKVFRHNFKK